MPSPKKCETMLNCAPGAVAAAKKLCLELGGSDPAAMAEMTASALADRWESTEAQSGIKAFLDKN